MWAVIQINLFSASEKKKENKEKDKCSWSNAGPVMKLQGLTVLQESS